MKNIAIVLPSFDLGGMEGQAAEVVNRLAEEFQFHIVSMTNKLSCRERIQEKGRVSFFTLNKRSDRFQMSWVGLLRIFMRMRLDVVVTFNFGAIDGILAAKLSGVKRIIHFERGFDLEETHGRKRRRIWLRRMLLPFADCVVVVSNGLFELAAKEWWVPEKKIIRFYNGVDTEKFIPKNGVNLEHNPPSPNPLPLKGGEEKGEEKALDNHIVIGTVASLSPVKNQKYLIEVVQALKQKHPNIRLVIAGDGPERSHLEALVHSKGLDGAVKFLGKVEETNEIYRGFDIFALTSFGEQMPNCILEAMASGLPIVSTNVGDISEMVACPNKRFVISGDEKEALLEAFEELIANPHLRSDLGRANRLKAIQHYSIDRTVEAYRNLFGK